MRRRFQFNLQALLVLVFGAACFFGGIAVGRRHEERQLRAERTATSEVIGKLLQSHTEALQATEKRIADLQKDAEERETVTRMPTLRQRAERMPTLREPSALQE
jgi:hypothetical protein